LTFPTASQINAIPTSEKGVASGVASLNASNIVIQDAGVVFDALTPTSNRYTAPIATTGTGALNGSYHAYGCYIAINKQTNYGSIGMEVTIAAGSGGATRLGIYKLNNGFFNLVLDCGTLDSTVVGWSFININVTLEQGLYGLVAIEQGNAASPPTVRSITNNQFGAGYSTGNLTTGMTQSRGFRETTSYSSSLPSLLANSTTTTGTTALVVLGR